MEYKAQCGDIFLCDSDRIGAKIVKFLQQSPTIYQQIWRWLRHNLEPVRFYHAGMILSYNQMIEQQWKVQYGNTQKILSRRIVIYRFKINNPNAIYYGITKEIMYKQIQELLKQRAIEDLGKGYDIPQIIGKTLTWLTGIEWFTDFLGTLTQEEEICVTRIGDWYGGICDFGVKNRSRITTKIIDEFCQTHSEEWELVYEN